MSKKDYIKFADMFKQLRESNASNDETLRTLDVVIDRTMVIFANDNNNFDTERFTDWIYDNK